MLGIAAPVAAGMSAAPYTGNGPPGTFAEPRKDQARHPLGDPLKAIRVTTVPYRLDPPVKQAKLSDLVKAPWPCERIRVAVQQYGRDAVKAYARAKGYTRRQIDEAMQCVSEKRT